MKDEVCMCRLIDLDRHICLFSQRSDQNNVHLGTKPTMSMILLPSEVFWMRVFFDKCRVTLKKK